ncbi:MAG: sigma-54 dependent transcriptional regulator [Abditibacteriales bacterium]|nr:sigma-54 dependent transcriptional regulator [Abditibacteriales bacterium]MDW8366183.1 sigma-54 dependent transcriptional regulator [Abditibacteriales bacterium]
MRFLPPALEHEGFEVATAQDGEEALQLLRRRPFDVVLTDVIMPHSKEEGIELLRTVKQENADIEVVVMTGAESPRIGIEAVRAGARDFITKPIDFDQLKIVLDRAIEIGRLKRQVREQDEEETKKSRFGRLIGRSVKMQQVYDLITRVAPSTSPVLILGESGTGKELVAREIHARSPRAHKPFLAVSCAAIPDTLLESELFGYVRGAFTDAVADRQGLFERASGGTLFLDEVGDTSPAIQAKLLRALEDGEVRRLGTDETVRVDVRIVAATNRDLERAIAEEKFRPDLYYRLNVVSIKLPPLRERLGDIPDLARHFVRKYAKEHRKEVHGIADEVLRTMVRYPWPGNVRELENVIERAILLCPLTRTEIQVEDLPGEIVRPEMPSPAAPEGAPALWPRTERTATAGGAAVIPSLTPMLQAAAAAFDREETIEPALPLSVVTLKELMRLHILWVLSLTNGDKTEAAKLLGISRATLYRELERMKGQLSSAQEEEIDGFKSS